MALSLRDAIAVHDKAADAVELVGVPLRHGRDRANTMDLLVQIALLRDTLSAKDAHIATLKTQVWAWKSQATNEAKERIADSRASYDREGELVRVIHHQLIQLEALQSPAPKKRWWLRRG